jgi:hypothetical protein
VTHIGKHKHKTITKNGKGKKKSKRVLESDDETPCPGQSPKYQESNDSTSATDTGDGWDRGSQYRIKPSSGGTQFTCENHKLCYICAPSF